MIKNALLAGTVVCAVICGVSSYTAKESSKQRRVSTALGLTMAVLAGVLIFLRTLPPQVSGSEAVYTHADEASPVDMYAEQEATHTDYGDNALSAAPAVDAPRPQYTAPRTNYGDNARSAAPAGDAPRPQDTAPRNNYEDSSPSMPAATPPVYKPNMQPPLSNATPSPTAVPTTEQVALPPTFSV